MLFGTEQRPPGSEKRFVLWRWCALGHLVGETLHGLVGRAAQQLRIVFHSDESVLQTFTEIRVLLKNFRDTVREGTSTTTGNMVNSSGAVSFDSMVFTIQHW